MMDFFLRGLGHFLQFPAHVMVLVGFGLLLGQQGWHHVRFGWLAFVLALVVGLGMTQLYAATWPLNTLLLGLACVVGCLLALRLRLPLWSSVLLLVVVGLLIGFGSAPAAFPGMKPLKMYAALAGTAVADSLTVLLLAVLAGGLRTLLDGVILRVLGSWVAASALMVLALMFAPR